MRALIADDDHMTTAILSQALKQWNVRSRSPRWHAAWKLLGAGDGPSLAIVD
jgi:hypothetical protein